MAGALPRPPPPRPAARADSETRGEPGASPTPVPPPTAPRTASASPTCSNSLPFTTCSSPNARLEPFLAPPATIFTFTTNRSQALRRAVQEALLSGKAYK